MTSAALLVLALLGVGQDLEGLKIDEKAGRVSFGAKTCKLDQHPQLKGAIEYLITMPRGKSYESCFETGVLDPLKLHEALQKIGLKPGHSANEAKTAEGDKLKISVEWKDGDKTRTEPIESFVLDEETKKPMANVKWIYAGSKEGYVPEIDAMALMVVSSKNILGLYQGDPTPLIANPAAIIVGHRYKANKELLPKDGTPVLITIEAAK
ncbi:MAG TPA: YdjY domain-containing protein [Planctomycetota bacterium]|jgi:hypothetical protein|nr:YdjY domain-containing protein [Planctomycetota bacterium]